MIDLVARLRGVSRPEQPYKSVQQLCDEAPRADLLLRAGRRVSRVPTVQRQEGSEGYLIRPREDCDQYHDHKERKRNDIVGTHDVCLQSSLSRGRRRRSTGRVRGTARAASLSEAPARHVHQLAGGENRMCSVSCLSKPPRQPATREIPNPPRPLDKYGNRQGDDEQGQQGVEDS